MSVADTPKPNAPVPDKRISPCHAGSASLDSPVQYLKGVGPARARQLAALGLSTVTDLLYHFPRAYQDRSQVTPIASVCSGEFATVCGEVLRVRHRRILRRRVRSVVEVVVGDPTGELGAVWFNQPYLAKAFRVGSRLILWGRAGGRGGRQFLSPEYKIFEEGEDVSENTRLMPVYPLTEGLSQKVLRRLIRYALDCLAAKVPEILPDEIRRRRDLCDIESALRQVHFPESRERMEQARGRLKYEELFLLELAVALRRRAVKSREGIVLKVTDAIDHRIRQRFPFAFTVAQDRVIGEIVADFSCGRPMNRLLQGDVGSGKTAVALYAILVAAAYGWQAAFMAPTEVLAEQHYRNICQYLAGSKVGVELLTGSQNGDVRAQALDSVASGRAHIVVGTHALLEEPVRFRKLALVVIDEQHKFGVVQRAVLRWKGQLPHVLVMTATPIPRTLAMTVFGDLDVSIIDQLPPGRQPVRTVHVPRSARRKAWESIQNEIACGRQAYIVYPLIEESEKLDLKAATQMAERLRRARPDWRIGLLHGRLRPDEKNAVMDAFRQGRIDLLVSTAVIEVGVDVPNATVMVVEHADRFGLAQLHQLRGRVGRGSRASHCFLFATAGGVASERLKILTETSDGFRIAEEDLRLRGPGELWGTLQHGLPRFRIANLAEDLPLVQKASRDASAWLENHPHFSDDDSVRLKNAMRDRFGDSLALTDVG